ncbi:thioredoxin [Streptomyces mirabilis]|uniref:thioredoxin n=1 Tax=Streptomyces mirabilis TaxID=68239 RepID=UPI0006CDBCA1|nr:thioredoxin [Actinobacteria bacterium OK006]
MSAVTTSTGTSTTVVCDHCGRKNRVPAAAGGTPRCGNCASPLAWIADAGDADFAEVAEQAKPYVVVDLWATWCGPCRMVSPALEQVAHELAGRVKLVKVDIDQNPRLAQRFQVQAVPTLLLLDKGEVIARETGAAPASALRQWVEETLAARR